MDSGISTRPAGDGMRSRKTAARNGQNQKYSTNDAARRRAHKQAHRQTNSKKHRKRDTDIGLEDSQGLDSASAAAPAVPINTLKAQIRQLARHLAHNQDLPADSRQDKERELYSLQETLAEALVRRDRRSTLSQYHMVRFFERKKATRALRKLNKDIEAMQARGLASSETSEASENLAALQALRSRQRAAEVDLLYTTHAPLEEKYISLFPKKAPVSQPETTDAHADTQGTPSKPPVWHILERAHGSIDSDKLIQQVRDGTHPELEALGIGLRTALEAKRRELQAKTGAAEARTAQGKAKPTAPRANPAAHATSTDNKQASKDSPSQNAPKNRAARRLEERKRLESQQRQSADEGSDGGFFEM